jgi:anti-anti-sigma regulatory factor
MVTFDKKKLQDGSLHVTVTGKIDERFDPASVLEAARGTTGRIVLHLGAVRSISSLGVRALESWVEALSTHEVVLIHVSPAIANQLALIPNLCATARVESAKLPFTCAQCGEEKLHSVPWRPGASREHAPRCACGAVMELDGLPEQYLPAA